MIEKLRNFFGKGNDLAQDDLKLKKDVEDFMSSIDLKSGTKLTKPKGKELDILNEYNNLKNNGTTSAESFQLMSYSVNETDLNKLRDYLSPDIKVENKIQVYKFRDDNSSLKFVNGIHIVLKERQEIKDEFTSDLENQNIETPNIKITNTVENYKKPSNNKSFALR